MGAGAGNEAGHWESDRLVAYHDSLLEELGSDWYDWRALEFNGIAAKRRDEIKLDISDIVLADFGEAPLFVIKDPRICRFAPFFIDTLKSADVDVRTILMIRNPLEVCESLGKRDGMNRADTMLLWLRHVLDAEAATRNTKRAIVTYSQLLGDWKAVLAKISVQLELSNIHSIAEITPQVQAFLSPDDRHHFRKTEDVLFDPLLRDWAGAAYEAFLVLVRNPRSRKAKDRLYDIAREFNRTSPVLHTLFDAVRKERDGEFSDLQTAFSEIKSNASELTKALIKQEGETAGLKETLDQQERQQAGLKTAHAEAVRTAEELTKALIKQESEIAGLKETLDQQEKQQARRETAQAEALRTVEELTSMLTKQESEIAGLKETLDQQERQQVMSESAHAEALRTAEELTSMLTKKESEIAGLKEAIEQRESRQAGLDSAHSAALRTNDQLSKALTNKDSEIARLETSLSRFKAQAEKLSAEKKEKVARLRAARDVAVQDLRKLAEQITKKDNIIEEFRLVISGLNDAADHLKQHLAEAERRNADLNMTLLATEKGRDEIVQGLDQAHEAVRTMKSSLSWRLTRPLRFVRREQLRLRSIAMVVASGLRLGGGLFASARKAIFIVKREGFSGLNHRYKYVAGEQAYHDQREVVDRVIPRDNKDKEVNRSDNKQTSEHFIGEIKRNVLENLKPLDVQVSDWTQPNLSKAISADEAKIRITKLASDNCRRIILSITHDDYIKNTGGVQLCVQIEQELFANAGELYVSIHPAIPMPILSRERRKEDFLFQVIADGQPIGLITGQTLIVVLRNLKATGFHFDAVIHSLLGHSPEVLCEIMKSSEVHRALFWLHDYFSVCPNHNLLRNSISFCGGPAANSQSCRVCLFGEERPDHLQRIDYFFNSVEFSIASPSQFALDLWERTSSLRFRKKYIVPHCKLTVAHSSESTKRISTDESTIVRVAFLGHPANHKGWPVFEWLATSLVKNNRWQFHHLGQNDTRHPNIQFTDVKTTSSHQDAMVEAMMAKDIDVAVLWSIWPETFSFTLYEVLTANALIVSGPVSGNIRAVVEEREAGIVVADEALLMKLFCDGTLENLVFQKRLDGRKHYTKEFGDLSKGLL